LGLCTSPILADQLLIDIDRRIAAACAKAKLIYTRYVDDITISGAFDLSNAGIPELVDRILGQHGFKTKRSKSVAGELESTLITGVRVVEGRLEPAMEYITELERQLQDALSLSRGEKFSGPFFTRAQLAGRIQFVAWINPRRKARLRAMFSNVDWQQHRMMADKLLERHPKRQSCPNVLPAAPAKSNQ
jgi:hypothetical protein